MMRYKDVLAECSEQRSGQRQQISMGTAMAITHYFPVEHPAAKAFKNDGSITVRWDELFELFFPKQKRSDAEWTVALAFHDYLYRRRNRTKGLATWRKVVTSRQVNNNVTTG